ncbi:hypothetical protein DBB36_10600 [Flavobacterium sp. WLB]|uniref:DUF2683 family protein n=1 Tax=unclassified Flavobacterium TaxID=196869 RepID=UPI0006AB8D46|nr:MULTISPECIES: DUF2683 family protein [unclassified Flavobacterium]KOP37838.1 hypothetical protein AKO67_13225 [Flavobacterium sp. VMW]OWU90931.1 hypothetical protein APR43_10675 [Flavobacterium sp. NLM]PUU69996.1 hypothetical protein DBB36_10600 [Flavobacterium sp. WLB]
MKTLTVKINERTKIGKAFIAMFDSFKGFEEIEIIETDYGQVNEERSIYSSEFVEKVKKAEENIKNGETTRLNPDDIWGSLGLK